MVTWVAGNKDDNGKGFQGNGKGDKEGNGLGSNTGDGYGDEGGKRVTAATITMGMGTARRTRLLVLQPERGG